MQKILSLFGFLVLNSCQIATKNKRIECNLGVINKGVVDARGVRVITHDGVSEYGGVTVNNKKITLDRLLVDPDIEYPPVKIEYMLMKGDSVIISKCVKWGKIPYHVRGAKYVTLMIYFFPGENRAPKIVWEGFP